MQNYSRGVSVRKAQGNAFDERASLWLAHAMNVPFKLPLVVIMSLFGAIIQGLCAEPEVVYLWPDTAPGETGEIGQERDMTKPTDNLFG